MIPPVGLPSEAGSTYFATGFGSFALLGDITFVAKILSMLEEPGDFYNSYRNLRPVLQTSKTLAGLAKRLLPIWLAQKSSLAPFTSGQLVRIAQSVGSELKNLYSSAAEPLRIRDLYDLAYFCPNIESLHLPLGFENRTQPPLSQVFNRFSGLQVVNDQNVLYTRSEKKWKTEAELIGLQSDCVRYLVSEEPQSGPCRISRPAGTLS